MLRWTYTRHRRLPTPTGWAIYRYETLRLFGVPVWRRRLKIFEWVR